MLAAVRTVLSYLNWMGFVVYIMNFAYLLQDVNVIISILVYVTGAILFVAMVNYTSKQYGKDKRIGIRKPLGNPFMDVIILSLVIGACVYDNRWNSLFVTGIIAVGIDLLLWGGNNCREIL